MKKLITLIIILLPLIGISQKLVELSLSNEDKAIGISYIDSDNHFIIGVENGTYKYDRSKVDHQKYKLGYSLLVNEILNGKNNLLFTTSLCYNKYDVIYNDEQIKKMPKYTCEVGVRSNLTDRLYIGFQYDIRHKSGGFNVSVIIFK